MQLTDIEEVMRSKEQEVAVLQQAIEQLVQEREAENREVMANSGKPINEISDRQKRRKLTVQGICNQGIVVCKDFWT